MKERKILGSRRKTKDEEMLLDEDLRRGGLRKEISEGMTWDHTFPWTTHGQGVNRWCIVIHQLQIRPMQSSKVNKENEANVD